MRQVVPDPLSGRVRVSVVGSDLGAAASNTVSLPNLDPILFSSSSVTPLHHICPPRSYGFDILDYHCPPAACHPLQRRHHGAVPSGFNKTPRWTRDLPFGLSVSPPLPQPS